MNLESIWSVSKLNSYVKARIDSDAFLHGIMLKAEISNFTAHGSGHCYFTLKDEKSRISCVMFASNVRSLDFPPTNGMMVLVKGNVSVFETSGQYQLYVTAMSQDGLGDLHIKYEKLKAKLAEKGYFDQNIKKPISKYPLRIGVVSGAKTAALEDVRNTIVRRWPVCEVIEFHCLVQGADAKHQIANSIKLADEQNLDVIIIARGGGSIEDLWAFNEIEVCDAIYACSTPLISGVGHEIDFTICDFVSDMRAATPTAAAELATPNIQEVSAYLKNIRSKLNDNIEFKLQNLAMKLDYNRQYLNRIDEVISRKELQLKAIKQQINYLYSQFMTNTQSKLKENSDRLNSFVSDNLRTKSEKLDLQITKLQGLNPLGILSRGYSVTKNSEGKSIVSYRDVKPSESINIRVSDGIINALVCESEELK